MGSSEKHYAQGICEMRDQKERVFSGKTASRELLENIQLFLPWNLSEEQKKELGNAGPPQGDDTS